MVTYQDARERFAAFIDSGWGWVIITALSRFGERFVHIYDTNIPSKELQLIASRSRSWAGSNICRTYSSKRPPESNCRKWVRNCFAFNTKAVYHHGINIRDAIAISAAQRNECVAERGEERAEDGENYRTIGANNLPSPLCVPCSLDDASLSVSLILY